MPCGYSLGVSYLEERRVMPTDICIAHIVVHQQGCRRDESGSVRAWPSPNRIVVRRVQRPDSACTRTVAPFPPYSPNVLEGEFSEVRMQHYA